MTTREEEQKILDNSDNTDKSWRSTAETGTHIEKAKGLVLCLHDGLPTRDFRFLRDPSGQGATGL